MIAPPDVTPHYEIHKLEPFRGINGMAYPKPYEVNVGGMLAGDTIYGCSGTGDSPKLAARAALRNAHADVIELAAEVLAPLLGR